MPSLIVVGKKDPSEVALDSSVTVIGRDRGVQLELSDFQVSRRHALVVRTDDGCFVKDLGSRNGVLVNSARVPSRRHQLLKNGDVLTLGRTAIVYKEIEGPLDPAVVATISTPPARPAAKDGRGPAKGAKAAEGKPAEPEARPSEAKGQPPKGESPKCQAPKGQAPKGEATSPSPEPKIEVAPRAEAAPAGRPRFVELAADSGPTPRREDDRSDPAVRALLRRLEVERIFYRNLALGLVSFLMILVIVLLIFALRRSDKADERAGRAPTPARSPADQVAVGTPAGQGGGTLLRPQAPVAIQLGRAGDLDEREFADTITPLLRKDCATGGCHLSPAKGAGDLVLEAGTDAPALARNLGSVKRFVVPGRPERSPLLTKPLRRDEGGEGHGGGDVLAAEGPAYQTIRAWIQRAAPPAELGGPQIPGRRLGAPETEAPAEILPETGGPAGPPRTAHKPVARIAPPAGSTAVGATLVLDGRASVCPTAGCTLRHHWNLTRPAASRAEITDPIGGQARFVPDVAGTYTVSLVVACEEGRSEAVEQKIAVEAAAAAPVAPSSPSALLRDAADGRAWLRAASIDVLGRGPSREEADRGLARTRDDVAQDLLGRDEAYSEWLAAECEAPLLADARPGPDVLTELAGRLKRREATAAEGLETLWSAAAGTRSDPEKLVLALVSSLHGMDHPEPAFVDAARRMVEGQSSALLGKTGRSPADLVKILVADRACAEHLARRTWLRLVGQPIDPSELERATGRLLDAGPKGDRPATWAFFDVVREWLVSPRYLERLATRHWKPERAFVRTLFQDVLGRTPDEDELRSARRSLRSLGDKGPLRSALAKVLLDSPQARVAPGVDVEDFVRAQFRQLLAREPRDRELGAFLRALGSGASRDTVVRAIVTAPEYASY